MLYSPHVQQYRAKKIWPDQKWQDQQADEDFFICLLTQDAKYGMIAIAWT